VSTNGIGTLIVHEESLRLQDRGPYITMGLFKLEQKVEEEFVSRLEQEVCRIFAVMCRF
jgi:hypothetical protein